MTSHHEIFNRMNEWTIAAPISNVEIDRSLNFEFPIDRLTLVTTEKLPGRRRRFGFTSRLSQLQKRMGGSLKRFLDQASVVGVLRVSGAYNDVERDALSLFRDELAILAASQLGYAKRFQTSAPAIASERPTTKQSLLWVSSRGDWVQPNKCFGPLLSLHLNSNWLRFQKGVFFDRLLRLIRREIKVAEAWSKELRHAAVLIGQSQMANSVSEAFLWNMIALELLLTRQGDKVGDSLPVRAEALLGWSSNWEEDDFEQKIRTAYSHRCRLVHQGDRGCPTIEDLYFTDDLLLSLLTNLVGHPALFRSKDDVIQFAKRVEAERLLGVKPKVRPRSLRILRRRYKPRDFDIY